MCVAGDGDEGDNAGRGDYIRMYHFLQLFVLGLVEKIESWDEMSLPKDFVFHFEPKHIRGGLIE